MKTIWAWIRRIISVAITITITLKRKRHEKTMGMVKKSNTQRIRDTDEGTPEEMNEREKMSINHIKTRKNVQKK